MLKKFLFENLGVKQTLIKNTFWLSLAEGIGKLLRLILIVFVARTLGALEYGKFTFAFSFAMLFVVFSDFGISSIMVREFSKDKKKENTFSSILSLKIILSIIALVFLIVGSFFITQSIEIRKIIWILSIFIIVDSLLEFFYSFLRSRQKMHIEALAKICQSVLLFFIGFVVIFNFPNVYNLSFSYLISGFVVLLIFLFFFNFKVFKLKINFDCSVWKNILLFSWPLALAGIASTVYSQIDSVMMGSWGYMVQTGWYNAAYRIIGVLIIPGAIMSSSFMPALSSAYVNSKDKFIKIYKYFLDSVVFISIPILIGGFVLAPKIINWVYDSNYLPSIFAMQILLAVVFITYLIYPLSAMLLIVNQQKKIFLATVLGGIVNVILNLILIPKFDLYGAAIATLITYIFLLVLMFIFLNKYSDIPWLDINTFFGVIISSAVMYFVITIPMISQLHVLLSVLIGAGVYLMSFLIYKKII